LHAPLVRTKRHPEHVRAHFARDALAFELLCELQEYLLGDVSERCPKATRRCELRNQHDGLSHDGVD
jgi:hypothetical protein